MELPVLHTERFVLRQLDERDVAPLYPTFSDEAAMRWWSRAPFASESELAGWLLDPTWTGRAWAAVPKEGGDAIGRFILNGPGEGVLETGYLVVKQRQGQGVARECLSAVLGQAFAEGNRRVFADVDPDNAASNRLCESLGFTLEGRLRAHWHTHIGVRDSLIWGVLAEEWPGEGRTR